MWDSRNHFLFLLNFVSMKNLVLLGFISFILVCQAAGQTDTVNQFDAQGKRTGYWVDFYPNGQKKYQAWFKEGNPTDTMLRFYPNGVVKARIVSIDSIQAYAASLFEENGTLRATGQYLNERKNGEWSYYNDAGIPLLTINYKEDTLKGLATRFYSNGTKLEQTHWLNNLLEGKRSIFNETGSLTCEIEYRRDQMNGVYKTYNDMGYMTVYGMYHNNLQSGKWQYFDDQGKLQYFLLYDKGVLLNPEVADSIQKLGFRSFDKNKDLLKDPLDYLDNPFSYIRK